MQYDDLEDETTAYASGTLMAHFLMMLSFLVGLFLLLEVRLIGWRVYAYGCVCHPYHQPTVDAAKCSTTASVGGAGRHRGQGTRRRWRRRANIWLLDADVLFIVRARHRHEN